MSNNSREAPEPTAASGDGGGLSEKLLNLRRLQSKMERSPYDYMSELFDIQSEFNSSLQLFYQHAAIKILPIDRDLVNVASDPIALAENLAETASFLGRVAIYYPQRFALNDFPSRLFHLLCNSCRQIPSNPRFKLAQALTLVFRSVCIDQSLSLFMELQTLGDEKLTKLASNHIFQSIWDIRPNQHRTRKLQTLMFNMLLEAKDAVAMRVLVILWKLYKREVWFDEKTANAICTASFHETLGIMTVALSSLLKNKEPMIENDKDHYDSDSGVDSPLNHLTDKQSFAERLFSRLQHFKEGSEVKMMMLKLTARVIGLHQLTLLDFYPFVRKYIQPHQPDIINLLPAVVQACHDKVPCDVVKPLLIQIVNQFVNDRSRPEAITIGLNAVREICIRMPMLMNDDLLQDLDLYEKSHEKANSVAVRSLITLFQEFCPFDSKAKATPKAYEGVDFATDVLGDELLTDHDEEDDNDQEDDQMTIDDESLGTES